ncbi:Mitochondrial inner membrane protease subunit 2 [Polyplax serrata]|uniref:Mitochondrial inner membrane protease subunit n=1 Tax=Polyplax serrata TaxID=468196 RepID=A0ABR1AGR9_POLSC
MSVKFMVKRIIKTLVLAIPVGTTFTDKVGYVARVDGTSMQPSLNPLPGQADFVVLNKWAVRNYEIERGDIISLISPKNPDQRFIKRVVGLEGDIVSTNGYKTSVVTIPQGHCWVEGDHIGSSLDSNTFGPVALGLVTAKATYIVWPPSRWRSLEKNQKGQWN